MAQELADKEAAEECNTSFFKVGFNIEGHDCRGSTSGNISFDNVPTAAACASRAEKDGCAYFTYNEGDKTCFFKNNSFDGTSFAKDDTNLSTSGTSSCQKAFRTETLDGDFATVVSNKTQFLEECSALLTPATCVDVVPGSIILTIGGASSEVLDKAESTVTEEGLKLPSFGTLHKASSEKKHGHGHKGDGDKDKDNKHGHGHHHGKGGKHHHHHHKNSTKGKNDTNSSTNATSSGDDNATTNSTNATNATQESSNATESSANSNATEGANSTATEGSNSTATNETSQSSDDNDDDDDDEEDEIVT